MSYPRKAFTLIELLVVVAIIALLISILLPSLSKARETARTVACLSIQKQMGSANIMYANAQEQWYVPFSSNGVYQKTFCKGGGFWGAYILYRQNLGLRIGPQTAPPGMVDPSKPSQYIEKGEWYRSFAFNGMGTGVYGNNKSVNRARVRIPSTKVMGMDAANWNITSSSACDPVKYWEVRGDTMNTSHMAYRHMEMTNMVMHDGHASTFTKVEAFPIHKIRITLYDPYKL